MLGWWRRWRSPNCAVWFPPDGSWGRDTHICKFEKNHKGLHECKCGASWPLARKGRNWEKDLEDALDNIRSVAGLHYIGGGFDPEHMRAISNYCAGILNKEEIPEDLSKAPEAHFIQILRDNGWCVERGEVLLKVKKAIEEEIPVFDSYGNETRLNLDAFFRSKGWIKTTD
jgi:hypothetical protein